jgi:hypothetical protein
MSAEEIKAERQKTVFDADKKALELCEDMETLKSVFLEINKHKASLLKEQHSELSKIKDERKTEIENPTVEKTVEKTEEKVEEKVEEKKVEVKTKK